MNKIVFGVLLSFFFWSANAQDFDPKVLVLPENPTYKDFLFLKDELKDVQVVLLGERTHFDGNVFEMKTEIVKYLYEALGFRTIAFESGVYDVWKAQQNIRLGTPSGVAFEKSLFAVWSRTKEFESFTTFFEEHKTELKVIGFDNQITGEYGEQELIKDLYDYCELYGLGLKLKKDDLELQLESIINSGVFDEGDMSYEKYKNSLTDLLKSIERKPKEEVHFYWKQIVGNLLSIGENSYFEKEAILSSFNTTADDNFRDKQMGANLLAYIKAHPGEKIICWGANNHFVNDMSSIETAVVREHVPMGAYLKRELGGKVYSLASITAADSIYLNKVWNKTAVKAHSFEGFLKNKNELHLFVSSKQDGMKQPQLNRLFSPITFIPSRLDLLHDGYLFFKEVKPSTFIEHEEGVRALSVELADSSLEKTYKTDAQEEQLGPEENVLDEVVIISYPKKFTYSVVRKAIENISQNYPVASFNSEQYSNIDVRVGHATVTNLDFITTQYDRGYHQVDRNSKQLKEVRWNSKEDYVPKNIREFWSLSYNNPIMYARFLNIRKSKKFVFRINEIKLYNDKKVYVVDFSIPRTHFTYTHRSIPSAFSGTLYINQDDYAVVKVIENWTFIENPDESSYETYGWIEKYVRKKITTETVTTSFEKINDRYYLSSSEIEISGTLYRQDKTSYPLNIYINSTWNNFKPENPTKISYKEEQNLFEKTAFGKLFWEKYTVPK